jgi:hypothetical protein
MRAGKNWLSSLTRSTGEKSAAIDAFEDRDVLLK